jgi:hypothetical protein
MSLGQALLRPQGLKDPPVHGPSRAFDILVDFIESLLKDPEGGPATLQALIDSGIEVVPAFLVSRQEKSRLAEGRIRQLVRPFNDILQAFLAGVTGDLGASVPVVLHALRSLLAELRAESLGRFLKEAIHLARHDLDVTPEALTALFRSFIEGAATRLQSRVDGGDLSEEALKRYELGLNLRNLEHLILDELEWPDLDLDVMVDSIVKIYKEKGIDTILGKIEKVLEAADALAEPLAILLETMQQQGPAAGGSVGARSVGAAAAGDPPPDAPSTVDSTTPFSWYASWVLHTETRFNVTEASTTIDPIGAIQYRYIPPIHMERIAFHTLWATDALETLAHIISVEKGDIASNMLNTFWDLFNTVNTPVNKLMIPGWMQWTLTPVLTFLGGLEGIRCSGGGDAAYPWIQIAEDLGETALYRRWTWMMREFLLSFLTLLNHKQKEHRDWFNARAAELQPQEAELIQVNGQLDATPAPVGAAKTDLEERKASLENTLNQAYFLLRQGNHNQFAGFMYGLGEVGAIILPVVLSNTDRQSYGFAGQAPPEAMIGKMFGGMAINLGFRGVSILLAGLTAWEFPDDHNQMLISWLLLSNDRFIWNPKRETRGENAGRGIFVFFNFVIEALMQMVYLYLFTNGNTSDGKFAALLGTTAEFAGYPPGAGSPYLLPWNGGQTKQCVQNPMGIWSHFPGDFQTYAYDFDHDAGDEVLCSRTGVVLNLCDQVPNNLDANKLPAGLVAPLDALGGYQFGGWNFMELLHLRTALFSALDGGVLPAASVNPTGPMKIGSAVFMPSVAHPLDPDPTRSAPGVPAPFATYADGTTGIFPGTRFPPFFTVTGAPWPLLPTPMSLHPTQTTFLSGGAAAAPTNCGATADQVYSFLDTGWDRGLQGSTFAVFSDGTPVPAGVVFAPNTPNPPTPSTPMYRSGTTFAPWQAQETTAILAAPVGLGTPGIPVAAGATFLDGTPIPAGVILPPDCGATPAWLPRPHPGTPLYLPGTLFTLINPGVNYFNAGTIWEAVGAAIPAVGSAYTRFTPAVLSVCQYGHGLQNWMQISLSPAGTAGQPTGKAMADVFTTNVYANVLGMVIPQGRVLMLSGDTGVSFYNHLHHHVLLDSAASRGRNNLPVPRSGNPFPFFPYTIPFVYSDGTHGIEHGFREAPQSNGLLRAMTYYESKNTRTGP